jgi:hypothetical protein
MTSPKPRAVKRFDVEGKEVRCDETDGGRLWLCDCAYFQRTASQYGKGFCPHTAVAIMRCLADGSIEL